MASKAWRDRLPAKYLRSGASLLLAVALVAGIVAWRVEARMAAQETGSPTMNDDTLPAPPESSGTSGEASGTGTGGPGRRTGPGSAGGVEWPDGIPTTPAIPDAIPQGTDLSRETLARLKQQGAAPPAGQQDAGAQAGPAAQDPAETGAAAPE